MKSAAVVRYVSKEGFWAPFQCQSGIIAKSTRHQTSAMPSQSFSLASTFFHHTPLRVWMLTAASYFGSGGASGIDEISTRPQMV